MGIVYNKLARITWRKGETAQAFCDKNYDGIAPAMGDGINGLKNEQL